MVIILIVILLRVLYAHNRKSLLLPAAELVPASHGRFLRGRQRPITDNHASLRSDALLSVFRMYAARSPPQGPRSGPIVLITTAEPLQKGAPNAAQDANKRMTCRKNTRLSYKAEATAPKRGQSTRFRITLTTTASAVRPAPGVPARKRPKWRCAGKVAAPDRIERQSPCRQLCIAGQKPPCQILLPPAAVIRIVPDGRRERRSPLKFRVRPSCQSCQVFGRSTLITGKRPSPEREILTRPAETGTAVGVQGEPPPNLGPALFFEKKPPPDRRQRVDSVTVKPSSIGPIIREPFEMPPSRHPMQDKTEPARSKRRNEGSIWAAHTSNPTATYSTCCPGTPNFVR